MRAPFRSLAVFIAGLLCLHTCSTAFAGDGAPTAPVNNVIIPGPLRSFLRMAGISQKVLPEDVLPLLARNSFLQGYENGRETEFLILLDRYVRQARELQALANETAAQFARPTVKNHFHIQILGYPLRENCGQKNAFI